MALPIGSRFGGGQSGGRTEATTDSVHFLWSGNGAPARRTPVRILGRCAGCSSRRDRSSSSTRCCSARSSRSSPTSPTTYDLTKLEAGAAPRRLRSRSARRRDPGRSPRRPDRPQARPSSSACACLRSRASRSRWPEARSLLGACRFAQGLSSATTWSGGARVGRGQHAAGTARPGARDGVRRRGARLRRRPDVRRRRSPRRDPLVVRRRRRRCRSPRARGRATRPAGLGDGEPGCDRQGHSRPRASSAACG